MENKLISIFLKNIIFKKSKWKQQQQKECCLCCIHLHNWIDFEMGLSLYSFVYNEIEASLIFSSFRTILILFSLEKQKPKPTKSSLKWKQKREVRTLHLYVTLISIERIGNYFIRHRFSFWQQLTALKFNSQKVIEKLQLNMCFCWQTIAEIVHPKINRSMCIFIPNLITILNIV